MFRDVIASPGYVERLIRHYHQYRETIQPDAFAGTNRVSAVLDPLARKRKRLRDPRHRPRR